jgi:hypothetical protein
MIYFCASMSPPLNPFLPLTATCSQDFDLLLAADFSAGILASLRFFNQSPWKHFAHLSPILNFTSHREPSPYTSTTLVITGNVQCTRIMCALAAVQLQPQTQSMLPETDLYYT